MIAYEFAHQFTPSPIRPTGDKSKIQLRRQIQQLSLTGASTFTPADTKEVLRLCKSSTANGPDGMSNLHIKKLAQGAINYLTNIYNHSISTEQIPEIWHIAIIISILKPGKDSNIGKNSPMHMSVASAHLHQQLTVSTEKSTVTLFKPDTHQHNLPTCTSESGRPSTTARKEANGSWSDARHPSHFHATSQ